MTFSLSPWDAGSLSRIFRGGQIYLFFFPLLRGAENVYFLVREKKKTRLFSSRVSSNLLLMSFEILSQSLHCLSKNEEFLFTFQSFFYFPKETNVRAYNQYKVYIFFFWALALNWLFFCGLSFCWIHSFFILYLSLHLFIHFWPLQTSGSLRT